MSSYTEQRIASTRTDLAPIESSNFVQAKQNSQSGLYYLTYLYYYNRSFSLARRQKCGGLTRPGLASEAPPELRPTLVCSFRLPPQLASRFQPVQFPSFSFQ